MPRGDRDANGKQDGIGHRSLEEFVDHLRTFKDARGDAVKQFHQHRHEQHADRCRQTNQLVAQHPQHIQQYRQQRAGSDGSNVDFSGEGRLGGRFIGIRAVWHQLAFTGQVRIAFAELVQTAGDDNGGEAAQHHHRQDASQRHALIHMQQRRIADRQRDRPFAHAARHDR